MAALENNPAAALILDHWLPDLEVREFSELVGAMFPDVELIRIGDAVRKVPGRSARTGELLHAIQCAQAEQQQGLPLAAPRSQGMTKPDARELVEPAPLIEGRDASARPAADLFSCNRHGSLALPDIVGTSAAMLQLAHLIRLVAPRSTSVLIEGPTGSGKELVASAVHRLSARAGKPFVTLNCAAIPESLLEAELFGHTRGAFTGAVQSRTGRVEAAGGGTLFLDEIGEMPLALQAKMLRFLENGEIQRIGGNETIRVDVRVVAATHQPLRKRAEENTFRLDLYHRLAVFPVRVPPLSERLEDIPALVRFFLERFGQEMPIKRLSSAAEERLMEYRWPGNVRELAHVLERATILAENRPEITAEEIWF